MKKIFVNGTFDVLHTGHLLLFEYAKSFGDYLIVAIDSDERVKEKKCPTIPINSLEDRAFMLSNLYHVDEVRTFGSDMDLKNLVKYYKPDIMIVGSDWKGKPVIGSEYAKELKFFDRINEYSTTKTIENIINRRNL
jgi:D-beta-D-heptose 7-phosphate kinase/D-beta-D-heptose 1-phosphate adenosyltransferase